MINVLKKYLKKLNYLLKNIISQFIPSVGYIPRPLGRLTVVTSAKCGMYPHIQSHTSRNEDTPLLAAGFFILFINLYIIVIALSSLLVIGGCFAIIHFLSDIPYDYVNYTEKPINPREEITKLIADHLKSLNDVDEAKVNIFWPEIELFKENNSEPIIANVIIRPKDDAELPFNEKRLKE